MAHRERVAVYGIELWNQRKKKHLPSRTISHEATLVYSVKPMYRDGHQSHLISPSCAYSWMHTWTCMYTPMWVSLVASSHILILPCGYLSSCCRPHIANGANYFLQNLFRRLGSGELVQVHAWTCACLLLNMREKDREREENIENLTEKSVFRRVK